MEVTDLNQTFIAFRESFFTRLTHKLCELSSTITPLGAYDVCAPISPPPPHKNILSLLFSLLIITISMVQFRVVFSIQLITMRQLHQTGCIHHEILTSIYKSCSDSLAAERALLP